MTLIEIQVSAIQRHHCTTHIEVADHLSEPDLELIIDQAFQQVEDAEFYDTGLGLEIEDRSWAVCRDLPGALSTNSN